LAHHLFTSIQNWLKKISAKRSFVWIYNLSRAKATINLRRHFLSANLFVSIFQRDLGGIVDFGGDHFIQQSGEESAIFFFTA